MKTTWLAIALVLSTFASTRGQGPRPKDLNARTPAASAEASVYVVSERESNFRVWDKIVSETHKSGEVLLKTNRAYVELTSGMHFWENNAWKESKETVKALTNGGAAAVEGPHKVHFPSDIYRGVIEVITVTGQRLKARPIGLGYADGTNSVMIAELKNSAGQILPSGNQIIYTNVLTDVAADLVATYRRCDGSIAYQLDSPGPDWKLLY